MKLGGGITMKEDDFYKYLGKYIKGLRKKKKMTQTELCLKFGLSRSSLSNVETGRHRLSIYDLYRLLRILNEN
jgi:transcriptional regulator with XRE-family HTH domain